MRMENKGDGTFAGTSRVIMKVASLLEWKGWKADARSYLSSSDEFIDVHELEINYTSTINFFHDDLDKLI
jgi:hypothetical protein